MKNLYTQPLYLLITAILTLSTASAFGQHKNMQNTHTIHLPAEMKWMDNLPSLPKGIKYVVLEGDPNKEGPFILQLKMPANYKIPAHWHPVVEHVTVLAGSIYMGMGDKLDESNATKIPVGGVAIMPVKMHHFAFTKEGTTIQLHSNGPWGITYINPADDPRNKTMK